MLARADVNKFGYTLFDNKREINLFIFIYL